MEEWGISFLWKREGEKVVVGDGGNGEVRCVVDVSER